MKIYLKRVRLNQGGYEFGKHGRYFGVGQPLFSWEVDENHDTLYGHLRASNRDEAKAILKKKFPEAKFFR